MGFSNLEKCWRSSGNTSSVSERLLRNYLGLKSPTYFEFRETFVARDTEHSSKADLPSFGPCLAATWG